jgi:phosphoribosyl-ATP pyrophosphohydrolase
MKNLDIIEELWRVIMDRKSNPKEDSYTNELLSDPEMILDKLKEELSEIESAAREGRLDSGKDSLSWEASDFIYHLLVLLAAKGVSLEDVLSELRRRR